ncbi:MAG: peptidylprolyl isomerase [Acidobacteria bacterium]|nr:peptidylprolyl isomerase [Acidobacteriota bacterium]
MINDDRPQRLPKTSASIRKNRSYLRPAKSLAVAALLGALLAGLVAADFLAGRMKAFVFPAAGGPTALFDGLSKEEMELLLEDAAPSTLKNLKDDPQFRREQIENLRQLFALANQAVREGFADEETTAKALAIVETVVRAQAYDKRLDPAGPPFARITDKQIRDFFGDGGSPNDSQKRRLAEFDDYFKVQLAMARRNKTISDESEPSAEEKAQMRTEFARIRISESEARAQIEAGALPEKFVKKIALQIKLQKAQFLSRLYSTEALAKKTEVTADEVQGYLAAHPEIDRRAAQKAQALKVLARLKNGEDFARLARDFSDDPASRDKGGLYSGVVEGAFDAEFESAALALRPGQTAVEPVETKYGYHLVRLERKSQFKDQDGKLKWGYDVRQIMFSTMVEPPASSTESALPLMEYVRKTIGETKEKTLVDKLVADNPVTIAEDFKIPEVSDEEMNRTFTNAVIMDQKNRRSSSNANLPRKPR